ncbi:MAG: GH92 family glycosyl hydrolase [Clostridia bacterium]|nr:GH92 family glycosyl hydrolase [Clostridia bacterium]
MEEKILFFTSFEKEQTDGLLESYTEEQGLCSVVHTDYIIPSRGLAVDHESICGTPDFWGHECKYNLFDGEDGSKFLVRRPDFEVIFALKEQTAVKRWELVSANDFPARDPSEFALFGSADGENWVLLDEKTGVSFSARFEHKLFDLENDTPYLWYKLTALQKNGAVYTQLGGLSLFGQECTENTVKQSEVQAGMVSKVDFGPIRTDCNHPGAWTGKRCLSVYGAQTSAAHTRARNVLFKDLHIPVSDDTVLSYVLFPGLFDIDAYDYEYTSCRLTVDLKFTDGSYLSELGAQDQNGNPLTPVGQVEGKCLVTAQWNYIECALGAVAQGKSIEQICVLFEMDGAEDASRFIAFFDDLKIAQRPEVQYEHLSDYINILRGTNNDSAFSRGLCTPAVSVPNGFNFYSPVTDISKSNACYNYQQNRDNNYLDSISVMHLPHFWLGSHGTWQVMANTSIDTLAGTEGILEEQISSSARRSAFTHQNEVPRAHHYSVLFNEGSPAAGVKMEVTPQSHSVYFRITFPEGAKNRNLIFDCLWAAGELYFEGDGVSFKAKSNHCSAGSVPLFICGRLDKPYKSASVIGEKKGILCFDASCNVVTFKLATSFLSYEQAAHNLALEIGEEEGFEDVARRAQARWDELLSKFTIEGASYTEKVKFYSSLYKMYIYPNLHAENEGTSEEPKWAYASPHRKGGERVEGRLYVTNGFWDTYRTVWGAYSLIDEGHDSELLDGMVQHYIDGGWMPRWTCPGGVNCMVGTSSDVIFADACVKNIPFNKEEAWASMIKNASAFSSDMARGGRPSCNTFPFKGFIPNSVGEGYSSSIEGYINDYGLYRMAEKLGLSAEAEYYKSRCLKYPLLFNPEVGFFMGKSEEGVWSADKDSYDPAAWTGPHDDYTESIGWVNAFPAVFDGKGLCNLYGGKEALSAKLDALFDDSIEAMRKVVEGVGHEICEFKEVKMGQYEHNNQPAHHVIFTYAFTDKPYMIQKYTREVLHHVYVGSEIGQGYPGDEDNGEMSAWYILCAMGLYPYNMASGEYIITSPLFEKLSLKMDNGKTLTVIAKNNSKKNVYIQSCTLNGKSHDKLYFTHEQLRAGGQIVFEMGDTPSSWGMGEDARPTSMTAADRGTAETLWDLFDEGGQVQSTVDGYGALLDNDSLTGTAVKAGDSITLLLEEPKPLALVTLACGKKEQAPASFKIEGSADGEAFSELLCVKDATFLFDNFIRPFAIKEEDRVDYKAYRITFLEEGTLCELEFLA